MTAVPTKLMITYGTYTASESVAAVFRSLRSYLERDETPPMEHAELLDEAVLLRSALDQAIAGRTSTR